MSSAKVLAANERESTGISREAVNTGGVKAQAGG
jgi:hypothetical protein